MAKYRIFYDIVYRNDKFDYIEDIEANSDTEAFQKTYEFIARSHDVCKSDGSSCRLTGLSSVTETLEWVQVKKETLRSLAVPLKK